MFDFLKNLTKSDEEKQQEAFSAYLDNTLSSSQRREFETQLAENDDLRAEVELAQSIRQQMNEMPRRSVPRSFTLDPNVYGAPQKEPLVQAYPFLRAATVMTAFFFVIALGLSVYTTQSGGSMAQTAMEPAPALEAPIAESEIAMEDTAAESEPTTDMIEETIIEEEVVVEGEAAEEIVLEEEAAEEQVADEADGIAAGALPQPTMTLASTMMPEMEMADDAEFYLETTEAAREEEAPLPNAPVGGAANEAAAPTPEPTATVSSLPRSTATATAVPKAVEPTLTPPDEVANTFDEELNSEKALNPQDPVSVTREPMLTGSQALLIGLGVLLLVLLAATFLARRRL